MDEHGGSSEKVTLQDVLAAYEQLGIMSRRCEEYRHRMDVAQDDDERADVTRLYRDFSASISELATSVRTLECQYANNTTEAEREEDVREMERRAVERGLSESDSPESL